MISISSHPLLQIEPLQAPRRCHPHFACINLDTTYSCTDLNITSYTSALAFSKAEILRVLQSQADLQEKTTYRSAPFWIRWWWSEGVLHALWKTTRGATSEVVRRQLAGRNQAWLLGRQHQLLLPSCVVEARLPCMEETIEGLNVTLNDPAGLCKEILIDNCV